MHARAWPQHAVALVFGSLSLVLSVLGTTSYARADDLQYSQLDNATVRVLSFKGVNTSSVHSSTGRNYVLGEPAAGHGSGLVVSGDGLVLTARHVIEDARLVAVLLPGQDEPLLAQVVYEDREHDLAFLVVDKRFTGFVDISLHKGKLAVRQVVYVVGYPLDASRTRPQSQQGIVSGTLPDGSLQLGIALNPGNSGGPVVDDKERLLGIAVARADPRAGAQGIGVAVPVEHILPGYRLTLKSKAYQSARTELAARAARDRDMAQVLATLLVADDANTAWQALNGNAKATPTSPSVDRRVTAALGSGSPSPDVLAFASAQMWNAAAVLEARAQSPDWHLARARELAQAAAKADPEVSKRSPFVAFVLAGNKPTSANTDGGGSADGEAGNGGADSNASLHTLLASLTTDKSLPVARIGPSVAFTAPFQLFGVGVVAKLALPAGISVDARYYYGWHNGHSELSGSHLFEGLVGIALHSWNDTTTAQLIVDIENNPGITVYRYVPGEVPTVHVLTAEAGLLSGLVNVRTRDPATGAALEDAREQVFVPEAGIRYTYFYHATSPYLARSTRSVLELSAHVMGPLIGISDDVANADGKPIERGVPGFKGQIAWQAAPLSWGETEIGGGYFPASGWIFAHVGWSYLFY